MSHCAHERPQERQQSNRRNSREDWDLEGVFHSLLDLVELADLVLRQLCTRIRETVGPVVHRISEERVNRQLGRRDPSTVITLMGFPTCIGIRVDWNTTGVSETVLRADAGLDA